MADLFHHVHFRADSCQHIAILDANDGHVLTISSTTDEADLYEVTLSRDTVRDGTDEPYSLCNLGLQGCGWQTRIELAADNRATVEIWHQIPVGGGNWDLQQVNPTTDASTGITYWDIPRANTHAGVHVDDHLVHFLRYYFPAGSVVVPEICKLRVTSFRQRVNERVRFLNGNHVAVGQDSHDSFPDEGEPGGSEPLGP